MESPSDLDFIFSELGKYGGKVAVNSTGRSPEAQVQLIVIQQILTIPQLQLILSTEGRSPEPNEYLLCFIDFIHQFLRRASAYIRSDEKIRYDILVHELTFLLTIHEDVPFQITARSAEVEILRALFETVAIEVASLIYYYLFESTAPSLFDGIGDSMMESIAVLNNKIGNYCINFSEVPDCVNASRTDPIDSLYIINSLLEDIEDLMNRGFDYTRDGVSDLIKKLQDELRPSRSVLEIFNKMPQYTVMNESLTKIRDIAYESEYLIKSYVIGNLPFWYLNLRLTSVISKIKPTRERLQEMCKIYGNSKAISTFRRQTSSQPEIPPPVVADSSIVGFEETIKKILANLLDDRKKCLDIISVVGKAGLGKTTITKKLYEDPSICAYFDRRGWCVASQVYDMRRMFIEILKSIGTYPSNDDIWKERDERLGIEIHKILFGRRYLVVIDDIWESFMADDLKLYFPENNNGSRIVLTSRISNVAGNVGIVHSLLTLSETQSWELLEKKVFFKESCPSYLHEIGKAIAANCGGLPLAVVVIAGKLRNVERETGAWIKVYNQLHAYMSKDPSGYRKILERSYDDLPNHLKLCFLYLGVFPEDSEIQIRNLVRMWIAEGFILKAKDKKQEDVAEGYVNDLINRNLLDVAKIRYGDQIKACTVHDLLREMCIKRAKEESFWKCVRGHNFSILEKDKRLYGPSTSRIPRYLGQHCRTFVGYDSETSHFLQMKLLRVTRTLKLNEKYVRPTNIEFPVNLRYLSHDRMPDFTRRSFTNLEFLNIEDSNMTFEISPVLIKMVKLRHMRIKEFGKFADDCESSETNNLEYLSNIHIHNTKDAEILKCCPHLRRLKCNFKESPLPDFSSFSQLEFLTIHSYAPNFLCLNFPSTIKKLHLVGLGLPWEKMSIVGGLSKLHVLKLERNAFKGEEWKTEEDEFPQLKFLKLKDIDLKQWNTDSEHFPQLQWLGLQSCKKLLEIPNEFDSHTTLQTIEVHDCNEAVNSSAHSIKSEKERYGDAEFKVIIRKTIV